VRPGPGGDDKSFCSNYLVVDEEFVRADEAGLPSEEIDIGIPRGDVQVLLLPQFCHQRVLLGHQRGKIDQGF